MRIFISSPGDVGEERELAALVMQRLQREFAGRLEISPFFWEHQPLRATASFQEEIDAILRPSQADVVIVILWSRLGTRLGPDCTRPDGRPYASGTEYEFEDAVSGYQRQGVPDLLVYRKTAKAFADLSLSDEEYQARREQKKLVDAFIEKWFKGTEGTFTAAFHEFASAGEFEEKLEQHLRGLIEKRRPGVLPKEPAPKQVWQRESPFRGLEIFDFQHAPIFCGRTQAISEILQLLRRQAQRGTAFVLIMGMSGGGKSSLVRAGVVPRLTQPGVIEGIGFWRRGVLRPSDAGGDLLAALAQALLQEEALPSLQVKSVAELAQHWRKSPETVIKLAVRPELECLAREVQQRERLARPPEARLALVVDQMEEIFTQEKFTPEQRQEFTRALAALARSGFVWVLATMRSDFYGRCEELPELQELKQGEGQYDLRPPTPAEIGQMIRQPAAMAGLEFEERGEPPGRLDDVLRDAASRNPQALPLLEFALEELYLRGRRGEQQPQVLTFAAYEEMGGLSGAIARRAEAVFESLPETERESALDLVLANLVNLGLGEKESLTAKRMPLEQVALTPASRELVDAFVATRLMVVDRSEDGRVVAGLAHEALLEHWEKARDWVVQNRDFLRVRTRIVTAAALWHGQEELPSLLLPPGKPLACAEALLARQREKLGEDEIRYIEASSREAARKKRRRALGRGAWVATVICLALSGLWYWDTYYRLHCEYYTNYTKRWSNPEGIGKITTAQASQRNVSYQFYRQGRKGFVTEVRVVQGCGEYASQHGVGTYLADPRVKEFSAQKDCRYVFERDAKGRVIKEKSFNRLGHLVFEFAYLSDDNTTASYLEHGRLQARSGAGAAFVVFSRIASGPNAGLEEEIHFLDVNGKPKPDHNGIYGERREFNEQGLSVTTSYLGSNGKAALHKVGYATATLKYDNQGNVLEAALYGVDGRPTLHKEGFFKWIKYYNGNGNVIKGVHFGVDGLPTLINAGYAIVTMKYDDRGNATETAYYGVNGLPTLCKDGYFKWNQKYDDRGNAIDASCFGRDSQPTLHKDGFFRLTQEYDDQGNDIETAYFGIDGQPTLHKDGNFKFTKKYDDRGNVIEQAFFGIDGQPTLHKDGNFKFTKKYDDRGNVIEQAFLGIDGQPTIIQDGYFKWTQTFDDRGNVIEAACYGMDDQPTLHKEGYFKYAQKIDDRGNVIEQAFFEVDGKPTIIKDGYFKWTQNFDERGNVIERAYFGVDGKPSTIKDGYFKYAQKIDHRGNVIERAYFGIDGLPTLHKDGNFKFTKKYDERGNVIEQAFFGVDGQPKIIKDGYFKWTRKFNVWGNVIEKAFFGIDGRPTIHKEGFFKWMNKYDDRGNATEWTYFDTQSQPTLNKYGYYRLTQKYDDRDNVVEGACYGMDDQPALHRDGYFKYAQKIDNRGNVIEQAYFGIDGQPTLHKDGNFKFTKKYDDRGNVIEQAFFGVDGQPTIIKDGYFKWTQKFDKRGNIVEAACYGVDGKPTINKSGFARKTMYYNLYNNMVKESYWGVDGLPARLKVVIAAVLPGGQGKRPA